MPKNNGSLLHSHESCSSFTNRSVSPMHIRELCNCSFIMPWRETALANLAVLWPDRCSDEIKKYFVVPRVNEVRSHPRKLGNDKASQISGVQDEGISEKYCSSRSCRLHLVRSIQIAPTQVACSQSCSKASVVPPSRSAASRHRSAANQSQSVLSRSQSVASRNQNLRAANPSRRLSLLPAVRWGIPCPH